MSAKSERIMRDMLAAVKGANKNKTSPYDTSATVTRIDAEKGTAWVRIPGSESETPVKFTIDAKIGDTVQVRVGGGTAWITGNGSAPPTDDTTANFAVGKAAVAQKTAEGAKEAADVAWGYANTAKIAADSAQTSAETANNAANSALVNLSIVEDVSGTLNWIREHGTYVRTTDTAVQVDTIYFQMVSGDYVPIANPDPTANPAESGWYVMDVTDSQSDYIMAHLAVTSAGLWVLPNGQFVQHPVVDSGDDALIDSDQNPIIDWQKDPQNAGGYKVLLSNAGMTIFDGDGVAVASYGIEMVIGRLDSGNLLATSNGIAIRDGLKELTTMSRSGFEVKSYDDDENEVLVAHIGYGEGQAETQGTSDFAPYYIFGLPLSTDYPVTEYDPTVVYSAGDVVSYNGLTYMSAIGGRGITPGESVLWLLCPANYSTTEGYWCAVGSFCGHAEGSDCRVAGSYGHAEGQGTRALGMWSHSEGYDTIAKGNASHAQNRGTMARYDNQTAIGKYNSPDPDTAFEIGNGSADNARSNALTVDWNGNVNIAGAYKKDGQDFIVVESKALSSVTLSASGGTDTATGDVSKTGYTPICIVAIAKSGSGSGQAALSGYYISGTTANVSYVNVSTSSRTVGTTVTVLYKKS